MYTEFTSIQKVAIPIIESGENCLIIAPTGGGKTEAALLPILNKLSKGQKNGIRAIYITPLRALNRDLIKRLERICGDIDVSISVRHGDTKQTERRKQAINPPQVLITTPESMQSILINKSLRASLKNIQAVIVDELHELYHNKRGAQLAVALERLVEHAGEFQRIGISATVSNPEATAGFLFSERKRKIADVSELKKLDIHIISPKNPKREHIELQNAFDLNKKSIARIESIADIVRHGHSTLIFANTRQIVESLGNKLIYFDNYEHFGPIAVHHGSLNQEERVSVENKFKEGEIKSIIATSSLELGIDIGSIDQVIQYNSPRQATRLVQRIGRSGHKEGRAASGTIIVGSALDALEAIAISESAAKGLYEPQEIEEKPYDVMINQICSMIIEYGTLSIDTVFRVLKRSYTYRNMSMEELERIVLFGKDQHILNEKDRSLKIGSRTLKYYYNNISLIADKNYFKVKNTVTNRVISNLDENFVSNYIDIGTVFITKGLQWRAISIEEDVIYVEPSLELEAAIPDWEGEDIPVSFDIAQAAFDIFSSGKYSNSTGYADMDTIDSLNEMMASQSKFRMPQRDILLIEEQDNYIVIFAPFGKKANEALSKIILSVVISSTNQEYLLRATPYAIIIELGYTNKRLDILSIIKSLEKVDVANFVSNSVSLRNSEVFRYRFLQISKAFGVLEKKAVTTKSVSTRLVDFYKDSPIFDETVRDLLKNYLDFNKAAEIIGKIKKNTLKIGVVYSDCSPFADELLRSAYKYRELFAPIGENSEEVDQFLDGIMKKNVDIYCTFCSYRKRYRLSDFEPNAPIKCENCKSRMVTILKDKYEDVLRKNSEGKRLTKVEVNTYREILKIVGLIEAYGPRAIIALSSYGVGPETASRLLRMLRTDERAFVVDIINAQKNFVKYKRFWKS